jgi:hypothetical protein
MAKREIMKIFNIQPTLIQQVGAGQNHELGKGLNNYRKKN